MTDEPSLSPTAPPPPTEADYEAIAAAVMGTVRGRWFLAEFAKRNRNADSALILERIDRIEKLLHAPPAVSPAERVRIDLIEMAKAIARTRSEIAAIRLDGDAKGTLSEASEELGSIVQTTERATSDILAGAERIQEIAWMLRERGADSAICDALDQRATDIYSACSFQDLTGQRTRKVVDVLQFLEDRIRAMIEIWGGAVPDEDGAPAGAAPHVGEDRTVPHLEQQDIDRMMPSARPDAPPGGAKQNGHDVAAASHATAADDWAHPIAKDHRLVAGIAASAPRGPAGGTDAAMAVATAVPAEAAAAAETMRAAETMMTPAMAVVGATALALDPTPIAPARLPEFAPEPEAKAEPPAEAKLQAEPEPELQAEAERQAEAKAELQAEPEAEHQAEADVQAEAEPEPQPELTAEFSPLAEAAPPPAQPEPPAQSPESEADAAPGESRTDPAAVLKRILAIIRAPSEPAAGPLAAQDASPSAPEAAAAVTAAAVLVLAPAAAEIAAADSPEPDVLAVGVAATQQKPAAGGAAEPDEPAEARAPKDGIDDASDDILMPLSGRLTVDQAIDAMLKAPGRIGIAATHARAGVPAPVEEPAASEPPAVTAGPVARATEPIAATGSQPSFVIDVPEFTVVAHAPPAEFAPEPAPVAETVAAAIAAPRAPEPQAVPAGFGAPMAAEAAAPVPARPDEPPADSVAAALAPPVTSVSPAVAASEPPPPVAPPAALPVEPARPARHPALAAITALSDEEKIALFS
jgi:hypothetical protein